MTIPATLFSPTSRSRVPAIPPSSNPLTGGTNIKIDATGDQEITLKKRAQMTTDSHEKWRSASTDKFSERMTNGSRSAAQWGRFPTLPSVDVFERLSTCGVPGASPSWQSSSSTAAQAQIFQLAGTIVDAESNAPLKRVRIALAPSDKRLQQVAMLTGDDGKFSFDTRPGGVHSHRGTRRHPPVLRTPRGRRRLRQPGNHRPRSGHVESRLSLVPHRRDHRRSPRRSRRARRKRPSPTDPRLGSQRAQAFRDLCLDPLRRSRPLPLRRPHRGHILSSRNGRALVRLAHQQSAASDGCPEPATCRRQ